MPTMQRLADNGLTYAQWHTTALCSPTRSVFLTGRNHHQNGFASISETSTGFPGYNSHIPRECASMATVLREAGWSTFWVGKNHNIPVDAWTMGSSKKDWPLGQGYDRFYGFIGGETNQWYPDLAEDNHYTDQPYGPEDGYHLSKDLADKALEFIRDSKQSEPGKPWYRVNVLASLRHELEGQGVALWLAGVHAEVQDMLARSGLADEIGRRHLYRMVEEAAGDASA
jgi:arylsulfatase A-like enzyme